MQDAMTVLACSPVAQMLPPVTMTQLLPATTAHAFFLTVALTPRRATSARTRFATMARAPIPVVQMPQPLTSTSTLDAMMDHAFTLVSAVARILLRATTTPMQR